MSANSTPLRVRGAPIPTTLRRAGKDDGRPPIVLVPGLSAGDFGFSAAADRSLVGVLTRRGRVTWSIDLHYSAFARSDQGFDAVLGSVRAALAALLARGEVRPPLDAVGHSLGGLVLLALATEEAPLRRIVTLATGLDYRLGDSAWRPAIASARRLSPRTPAIGGVPIQALSSLAAPLFGRALPMPFQSNNFHPGVTDAELIRRIVRRGMRDLPTSLLLSLRGLFEDDGVRFGDPPRGLTDAVDQVDLPVLMVGGRQDRQCTPETVRHAAERVPGARLLEVGAAGGGSQYGHYDLITGRRAAEDVFEPLGAFLDEDAP